MKIITVSLADIEGVPHGSASANTNVKVTAVYTSAVVLADGRVIPQAVKGKQLANTGVVEFSVYASDDPTVAVESQGFAIRFEARVANVRGEKGATYTRTVKPLMATTSPVSLGSLAAAEPVPPQWVSVADFAADLTATATDALAAAQSAQADAAQSAADAETALQASFATVDSGTANLFDTAAGPLTQVALYGEPTAGSAMHKAETGAARTVAMTGHSLMYGMDTTAAGTNPPVNGAGLNRSVLPTPERFQIQCTYLSPGPVTAVNQAYPGDRSTEALTRWSGGTSGDMEFIWIDTNDGLSSGAGPALSDADSVANLVRLIKRARRRGADVVVVGGAPGVDAAGSRKIFASAQAERAAAERHGARYVDAGEILRALPRSLTMFSSGVHFQKEGYNLIGQRLAALMGPKGTNPPKVAPGSLITPRDMLTVGGTITARAGTVDGSVWTLATGQILGLSFDVTSPCVALVRCRVEGTTTGFGVLTLIYNTGGSGRPNKSIKLASSAAVGAIGAYATLVAHPNLSPGPDSLTIQANAGPIEIDAIEFVDVDRGPRTTGDPTFSDRRTKPLRLTPVGGVSGGRADAGWDTCFDVTTGVPITTGSAGTTKTGARWLFDVNLGAAFSGIGLAQTLHPAQSSALYAIAQGYMIVREGANLIVRQFDGAGPVDVTVTGVFPATGIARAVIEVWHDPAAGLKVYVDGVLRHTVAAPVWTFYMAGLISASAATGAYSAGVGSVTQ